MSKVYLVTPTYDGRLRYGAAVAIFSTASRRHQVTSFASEGSLLPHQCTSSWCDALNRRDAGEGWDWLAMLHEDVVPDDLWLDRLIEIAEANGADFLSAVVPLKNDSGFSSTALRQKGVAYSGTGLTQSQINHPDFPETFDARAAGEALAKLPGPLRVADAPWDILLANTGCMVCRLNRNWCDRVWFDNRVEIVRRDGKRTATRLSEDYFFTQKIAEEGGRVFATRAVRVRHFGQQAFDSAATWGQPRG